MNSNFFQNNPELQNIAPEKLKFITEMAAQNHGSSPREMMTALMAASMAAKKNGISFQENEMNLILEVLQQNISEDEKKKVDIILQMMKNKK